MLYCIQTWWHVWHILELKFRSWKGEWIILSKQFVNLHSHTTDAHNDQDDELEKLKAKVAHIVDRSRWNNVKLRGVPESVQNTQLNQYACDLICMALPSIIASEIVIYRIHCLPKPFYLPDNIPRDIIIMRVHFYLLKDQLMSIFCKTTQLPEKYSHHQMYADISQYMLQKNKVAHANHEGIAQSQYHLPPGYPMKLTITHNDDTSVITMLIEGLALLWSWDILPDKESTSLSSPTRVKSQDAWQVVSNKCKQKSHVPWSPLILKFTVATVYYLTFLVRWST